MPWNIYICILLKCIKMRFLHTRIIKASILSISLTFSLSASAVKAKPGVVNYTQPDGSVIEVVITGDAGHHNYYTPDGQLLTARPDGRLVEATESEAAALLARKAPMRVVTDTSAFPTTGEQNVLVIMVQFTDKAFTYGHDRFDRMLNEPGFSDFGASGSAADYYIENSGSRFKPSFDLYGPVTLAHDMAYYGGNNDAKAHEIVAEACRALDDEVDFSRYDRNGDGWVDNVYVFYAGHGEGDGGGANSIWPHSSNLYTKGVRLQLDGVQVGKYACSNELNAGGSSMVGMGTFCHEFGHVLGLPDLYTTDYSEAFTPGNWSLMDHGNYNNNGRCPAALTAFERSFLGWMEPIELTAQGGTVNIPSIEENVAYVIPTGRADEYFLLENRQQAGWDKYLPGHGMLVWHIDYNASSWALNTVNNTADHQRVDIVEADGVLSEATIGGDAFPGTMNVAELNDIKTWATTSTGFSLKNISEKSGLITLEVNGVASSTPAVPSGVRAIDIADNFATLGWDAVDNARAYIINVYTLENGRPRHVQPYNAAMVEGNQLLIEGLQPETEYLVSIASVNGVTISELSEEVAFTTDVPGITYYAPEALGATEVTGTSFVAKWSPMAQAKSYELSVYTMREGAAASSVVDFSDKLNLPEGWTTNCSNTMSVRNYYGEAAPSLRMLVNADNVTSPEFATPITSLSFWMRGYQAAATDALVVKGYANGAWRQIARYCPIDNAAAQTVDFAEEQLGGATRVSFSFEKSTTGSGNSSVVVDDIKVGLGNAIEKVAVVDGLDVGDALEYQVSGLAPLTEYTYSVVGVDGARKSKISNEVSVTTKESSAIGEIEAETAAATTIYAIDGRIVNGSLESLPAGVYIIKSGDAVQKITVK